MNVVSVVMPIYNAEKYLNETLTSVEQQIFNNWKLIAVDDCSDDASFELLQAFKNKHPEQTILLKSPLPKSGASACRNLGLKYAKGEFIIFLDSDDLIEPFCLTQRVAVMKQEQNLDWAVFNQYAWFHSKQPPYSLYNKQVTTKQEAIMHFLKMDSAWQTMAVIWSKKAIEQLNGFDESLYFMEDPYLHLRALLRDDLKVAFKTNLPADSFYRMPNLTASNAGSFYTNSISSRFVFLKKVLQLLPQKAKPESMQAYRKYIRDGFIDFVKVLLAKRLTGFQQQFDDMLILLSNKKILNTTDLLKLRLFKAVGTSNSPFIKTFRLRGLVHKLL